MYNRIIGHRASRTLRARTAHALAHTSHEHGPGHRWPPTVRRWRLSRALMPTNVPSQGRLPTGKGHVPMKAKPRIALIDTSVEHAMGHGTWPHSSDAHE